MLLRALPSAAGASPENDSALTRLAIENMISTGQILNWVEFYTFTGNADTPREVSAASGGRFRALNNAWADNRATPGYGTIALQIFGDELRIDRAHERRGQDVTSVMLREFNQFTRMMGKQFQAAYFNGNPSASPAEIRGLVNYDWASALAAQTFILGGGADGAQVNLGNSDAAKSSQQQFLEAIDYLIELVDGGAQLLLMDSLTIVRLTTIAREFISYQIDEFGRRVTLYNDVPIVAAGRNAAGDRNIGHDEVVGGSDDCTSVYAVRHGEETDFTFGTNVGIDATQWKLLGNDYQSTVEFDVGNVLLNPKSIARLQGVRLTGVPEPAPGDDNGGDDDGGDDDGG